MKIRTFFELENGIYKVVVNTEQWSQLDMDLMAKFGEPEINKGGDIDGTISDTSVFMMPDDYVRIMSQSPITESWDSQDYPLSGTYPTAKDRAELWQDEIVLRIEAAVAVLRALQDTYSREEVEEV